MVIRFVGRRPNTQLRAERFDEQSRHRAFAGRARAPERAREPRAARGHERGASARRELRAHDGVRANARARDTGAAAARPATRNARRDARHARRPWHRARPRRDLERGRRRRRAVPRRLRLRPLRQLVLSTVGYQQLDAISSRICTTTTRRTSPPCCRSNGPAARKKRRPRSTARTAPRGSSSGARIPQASTPRSARWTRAARRPRDACFMAMTSSQPATNARARGRTG